MARVIAYTGLALFVWGCVGSLLGGGVLQTQIAVVGAGLVAMAAYDEATK